MFSRHAMLSRRLHACLLLAQVLSVATYPHPPAAEDPLKAASRPLKKVLRFDEARELCRKRGSKKKLRACTLALLHRLRRARTREKASLKPVALLVDDAAISTPKDERWWVDRDRSWTTSLRERQLDDRTPQNTAEEIHAALKKERKGLPETWSMLKQIREEEEQEEDDDEDGEALATILERKRMAAAEPLARRKRKAEQLARQERDEAKKRQKGTASTARAQQRQRDGKTSQNTTMKPNAALRAGQPEVAALLEPKEQDEQADEDSLLKQQYERPEENEVDGEKDEDLKAAARKAEQLARQKKEDEAKKRVDEAKKREDEAKKKEEAEKKSWELERRKQIAAMATSEAERREEEEELATLRTCVVIPCAAAHIPYLGRCLNSVQTQTRARIASVIVEVSAVNASRCPDHLARDNIQIFCTSRTMYAGEARNSGARRCVTQSPEPRADFITFLDADDELLPYAVARMLGLMRRSNATVGLHDYLRRHEQIWSGNELTPMVQSKLPPLKMDLHMGHLTVAASVMGSLQQKPKMRRGQDSEFVKELILHDERLVVTPEKLSVYRGKRSEWEITGRPSPASTNPAARTPAQALKASTTARKPRRGAMPKRARRNPAARASRHGKLNALQSALSGRNRKPDRFTQPHLKSNASGAVAHEPGSEEAVEQFALKQRRQHTIQKRAERYPMAGNFFARAERAELQKKEPRGQELASQVRPPSYSTSSLPPAAFLLLDTSHAAGDRREDGGPRVARAGARGLLHHHRCRRRRRLRRRRQGLLPDQVGPAPRARLRASGPARVPGALRRVRTVQLPLVLAADEGLLVGAGLPPRPAAHAGALLPQRRREQDGHEDGHEHGTLRTRHASGGAAGSGRSELVRNKRARGCQP